jgi:acyl-coenzyme A synthetase/AMP-(fatty) acid ligase
VAQLLAALRAANRGLAEYKRIESYVLWEAEFPRTASMKIKRDELARHVRAAATAAAMLEAS